MRCNAHLKGFSHRAATIRPRAAAAPRWDSGILRRHARRLHENAWARQRLHHLRRAGRRLRAIALSCGGASPRAARGSALIRRCSWRSHATRARPPTTASSTPTAAKSSSAATARAVSLRCCAAAGRPPDGSLTLESAAGLVRARMASGDLIAIDLGVPDFAPAAVPFEALGKSNAYRLHVAGEEIEIGAVSIGNPHAVLAVADVATRTGRAPGSRRSSTIRASRRASTSASCRSLIARAYGCAFLSAARAKPSPAAPAPARRWPSAACAGSLTLEVQVLLRGGELRVNWEGPGEHIWLTGPAEVSFEGYFEV